jgi:hypothetical protein
MDALIDQAEEIGLRDAGAYLQKTGRYPTEDDTDDFASAAWAAALMGLRRRGADHAIYEACFEAWSGGFLGTRA